MGRRSLPLRDTVRGEIYYALCEYSEANNTIPNAHSFWSNVLKSKGYEIAWSTFRHHWKDLMIDGLIKIDTETGGIIITDLLIIMKED